MLLKISNCSLLIVDVQEKLFNKIFEYKILEDNILKVIDVCSTLKVPIIISEQYPKGLGKTIPSIQKRLKPYSIKMFEKTTFSCFPEGIGGEICENYLKTKQIILIGIETHICILQTAFDLKDQGYEVFIVDEGVGSRQINDKELAKTRFIQGGVEVINFEMMLFELIRDSKNDHFKELSKLLK